MPVRTRSRKRIPFTFEILLAPFGGLLFVLAMWLVPLSGFGSRAVSRCVCGAPLARFELPELAGPDPVLRAPVLRIDQRRSGRWLATLDGAEVAERPSPDDPDWKLPRLVEQLEVRAHNARLAEPRRVRPPEVLVQAPASLPASELRYLLYSLELARQPRVQLLLPGAGRSWYTAAYVRIVREAEGDALAVDRFKTYGELARAVVALRLEGRPVRLAYLGSTRDDPR
jgi:hypothetical protein